MAAAGNLAAGPRTLQPVGATDDRPKLP